MNIGIIELCITSIALCVTIYFTQRAWKKQLSNQEEKSKKDREESQRKEIDKAVEDAQRHTEIMSMLRNLSSDTKENRQEISKLRDEVKTLNDNQIRSDRDVKTAFQRIEKIEKHIGI